ncbi:MAG: hypothetical protein WCJ61_13570 [Paludibacter sp.]
MKTTQRKIKFLPVLQSEKYKFLFVAINIYLMVGVGSLLFTILYLLFNLSNLDNIIYYAIPGFVVFLSAALLYAIGYQTMMTEQKQKHNAHKHHLG